MASASDFTENMIVEAYFRGGSWTPPTNIYVALCTAATTDADTGSTITEVSGGSYARVQIDPGSSNWTATSGTDGITGNASTLTYPIATADWGDVSHIALCDASSGGNLLFHGALSATRTVSNGDVVSFNAGSLAVTVG